MSTQKKGLLAENSESTISHHLWKMSIRETTILRENPSFFLIKIPSSFHGKITHQSLEQTHANMSPKTSKITLNHAFSAYYSIAQMLPLHHQNHPAYHKTIKITQPTTRPLKSLSPNAISVTLNQNFNPS